MKKELLNGSFSKFPYILRFNFRIISLILFRSLLYMIKKAAINIKRMNPEITLESLFLPKNSRFNPKTPIVISFRKKEITFFRFVQL